MVQFAEVLTQVGIETGSQDAPRGVRVNTAGWDSWLKQEYDDKAPTPGSFYVEDFDADELATEQEASDQPATAAPVREEILRSSYAGPGAPDAAAAPGDQGRDRPPLDLAMELAHVRLQHLTTSELRALRRRLARRVHPDLPTADQPDPAAMVRVNVAIDAALEEKRAHARRR